MTTAQTLPLFWAHAFSMPAMEALRRFERLGGLHLIGDALLDLLRYFFKRDQDVRVHARAFCLFGFGRGEERIGDLWSGLAGAFGHGAAAGDDQAARGYERARPRANVQRRETQVFEEPIGDLEVIFLLDRVLGELVEEPQSLVGGHRGRK